MKRRSGFMTLLMMLCVFMLGTGQLAHAGDAEQGKKLYGQFCASCHGQSGKGDGPAAAALTPKPRDHTSKEYMAQMSDEEMFKVIKGGGAAIGKSPLMPPWGASLKDDQILDVVAYIRTLCCQ